MNYIEFLRNEYRSMRRRGVAAMEILGDNSSLEVWYGQEFSAEVSGKTVHIRKGVDSGD